MLADERELLLRTGELALDFYEAPDVCRRLHMRGKRSKARWRSLKGVELVEPRGYVAVKDAAVPTNDW